MKRFVFLMIFALALMTAPIAVSASDGGGASGLAITVVIPDSEPVKAAEPAPTPKPNPARYLYPVSVSETHENGRREIVKAYELGTGEKPEDISRESFTREGWLYELTDIIKKETATADAREHEETLTLNTDSKDTEAIMKLLAPTLDYQSEDGYVGVLELDISTVKVETAGIKNESFTASAVREYPHLSTNDSSLVPKTITDGGREYTLANIDWRTQNSSTVDYDQLPDSYTAVAKYTRTGYKEVVTGYVTTAIYRGNISKILSGKTVYTAYFIGVPIVSATVGSPETEPATESASAEITAATAPTEASAAITEPVPPEANAETPEPTTADDVTAETEQITETETAEETISDTDTEPEHEPFNFVPLIIIVLLAGAGIGGGFVYKKYFYKPKIKEEEEENEDESL
jgi:hypothetical protein